MILSNSLLKNVTNNLKLESFELESEKFYTKQFIFLNNNLKSLKENNFKKLSLLNQNNVNKPKNVDIIVRYIISISFLKANTIIHVSDSKGKLKLFYSAGVIGLTGKQKKKRRKAVSKLIFLLLSKSTFLGKNPVALHLNNVNSFKTFIVHKLKPALFIKVIKTFNQVPFNGCRKKKIRRKKYIKKLK